MSREQIERFYSEHKELQAFLLENGQISYAVESGNNFRRSLVLAVASFFEHEVCEVIKQMPERYADGNSLLKALVETKAVNRQYHTYFDWDNLSATRFFGSFGEECKASFQAKLKSDAAFKNSVAAFLELGQTRNRLVHRNYVQFDVDKSPDDLYALFELALSFLDYIRQTLLPLEEAMPSAAPAGSPP